MIFLSREAQALLDGLLQYYERLDRIEAAENLLAALERARDRIACGEAGLPAPRPYSIVAGLGFRWIKERRYWIGYSATMPPVIVRVFHDTADIPGRVQL